MRLKAALLFMLLGTTSCLQFLDECMPMKSLEAVIKGSEMKLRVWVPEIGDSNLVTLISANSRTGKSRRIEIRKSGIIIQARDVATVSPEQELRIQNNSLPYGWVTFMVTSDENFTVTVPDANLTLIHIPDVVQDKNIKIRESYATVNCMLPAHHWEVSAGEEAFIPLSPEGPHDFSLFARAPFVPELAVGLGSLGPLRFPSLSSVFELESEQMAAFSFYNFTLVCTIAVRKSSCYIQAGDYRLLVGSLPREAASLSLTAGGTDDYIIVHGIRKDQKGEITGDQSEDKNGGGPCARLTPTGYLVSTGSCIVGIIFTCIVMTTAVKKLAAFRYNIQGFFKKKQKKREKSHTVTDQGGNKKKEGNESRGHYTTIPLMEERPSSLDSGEESPSSLDSGVTTSSSCSLSSSEKAMVTTSSSCSLSSSETAMVTTSSSCSLSSSEKAMESTKQNQAAQIKEERRTHLYPVSVEACVA